MDESSSTSSSPNGPSETTRPQHDYLVSTREQLPSRMSWQRSNLRHGLSRHRVGPYGHEGNQPLRSHSNFRHDRDSSSSGFHEAATSTAASPQEHGLSSPPSPPTPSASTKNSSNKKNINTEKNRLNRSLGGFNASERPTLHPYLTNLRSSNNGIYGNHSGSPFIMHECQELLSQPQGLTSAVVHTFRRQGQRFIDALVGRQPQQDSGATKTIESTLPTAASRTLVLLPIIYIILKLCFSSIFDNLTNKNQEFQWIPYPKLDDRKCVLNLFIDKQKPDEFNPDFKETTPIKDKLGRRYHPPHIPDMEPGSYRTKGQTTLVKRFISSVADSFRPSAKVQQHLVFAGTRDGGHLAENALTYWPPRGKYRTQVYILADSVSEMAKKRREEAIANSRNRSNLKNVDLKQLENVALDYGPLGDIEERFQNHVKADNIHIYDSKGQVAGLIPSDIDDDDVVALREEAMFGTEGFDDDAVSHLPPDQIDDDSILSTGGTDYISLKKLMAPHLERDEAGETMSETEHIIPYLHIDGLDAARQFDILQSARPLLLDNTVATVVVEHSPNLDIYELIDFFNSVNYKTFFLGLRSIARIDHMCPEILEQIINHPFITPDRPTSVIRKIGQALGIVGPDKHARIVHPHEENSLKYPPFFVAFPRGRVSKEEMTIQHMYDLFSGLTGGGSIKTANDRE